jgi:hypothetical protein
MSNPPAAMLGTLAHEREKARAAQGYAAEQNRVAPSKDALSASTLIQTSLAQLPNGPGDHKNTMVSLGAKLSRNTLIPWAKGAALIAGDQAENRNIWGDTFTDNVLFNGEEPRPFLQEIRRRYGNGWDAALQAAAFVQAKQRDALFDSLWNQMPAGKDGWDSEERGFEHQREAQEIGTRWAA